MPLDKGATGRDPDLPGSAYARKRKRRRRREPDAPTPVRGEDVASKARAPQGRTVKRAQARDREITRQYGVGRLVSNAQPGGLYALSGTDALVKGAIWSATHPVDRLRDRTPAEFESFTEIGGHRAPLTAGVIPWGPTGRFLRRVDAAEPPPTAPAAIPEAEALMGALPEARKARRAQDRLYSQERASRFEEADRLAREIGGREGHEAALRALAGELPKVRFEGGIAALDEDKLTEMFRHINDHPDLSRGQRVRARDGLIKVMSGGTPQPSEIKLFEKAFGVEAAEDLATSVGFWRKAYEGGLNVLNVPRSLQASVDLSAPFRQGLALGARHPVIFARELRPMLKAFRSENAHLEIMDSIYAHPNYPLMKKGGLAITDLEGGALSEEQFASHLAETLTGGKRSPVRMSGRAYVAFLNKFRADVFNSYVDQLQEAHRTTLGFKRAGLDLEDPANQKALKDIASWVNHATGRGSIKGLEGAMRPLNVLLFSPRLMASRLQLLNPVYYARLDPFARKQALRGAAQLVGTIGMTLSLAKLAGARVNTDPRSSDFGKIRIGDTRIDVAGGFQQYIVAAERLRRKESVSAASGKVVELEGGFMKPSRSDLLMRFGRQKLAPVPGLAATWLTGETFEGDPFDPRAEAQQLVTPIGIQNTVETYQDSGAGAAVAGGGLGAIGFGVQTFPDKLPEAKGRPRSVYARSRSGGGSRYARRSSGGGSAYARG